MGVGNLIHTGEQRNTVRFINPVYKCTGSRKGFMKWAIAQAKNFQIHLALLYNKKVATMLIRNLSTCLGLNVYEQARHPGTSFK